MVETPRPGLADVKAQLAALGAEVSASAQVDYVRRPGPDERVNFVVVDLVALDDGLPEYCIHGYATCFSCDRMCYLGSETHKAVVNGTFPICLECAQHPRDHRRADRLRDHRRADGPHDQSGSSFYQAEDEAP